jgi:hypothetical protein
VTSASLKLTISNHPFKPVNPNGKVRAIAVDSGAQPQALKNDKL